MELNQLADNQGARKSRIRVGRGVGSGKGKTCGRGVKGQTSRSGVAINGFEGGQMPIHRRLPKRGFTNIHRTTYSTVNVGDLQAFVDSKKLDASKPIAIADLVACGLVRRDIQGIKLLGNGELKAKLTIEVVKASEQGWRQRHHHLCGKSGRAQKGEEEVALSSCLWLWIASLAARNGASGVIGFCYLSGSCPVGE